MYKSGFFIVFFTLWYGFASFGQLSEGGFPREFRILKHGGNVSENMPDVNNEELIWLNIQEQSGPYRLKPLRFAHPFEVAYNTQKNGEWQQSSDGWWIWQLRIRSAGAYSLNLLFTEFALPHKARLFLFTPTKDQILGAFTAVNNSDARILQVAPLPGEELLVQYETPFAPDNSSDFTISRVNHDFIGILKYVDKRRPLGNSGTCNTDVNCMVGERWSDVQNSVCRIMVEGLDLCSGTLLNNTAQNQRPFVITAGHCISKPTQAQGSLFLFNYESPYCGPLDGDVSNSLSGSVLRATLDSLDFTLVELNTPPPPSFRPYYAGWSRSTKPADTIASIHHPQGDIKKIAIDNNPPAISTFRNDFLKSGFWKSARWEYGTTEDGSSGSGYFNQNSKLIGTLSGGAATCANPVNDYFARFDLAWDYRSDTTKQLKYWLDPLKRNAAMLDGRQFNSGQDLCGAFCNLKDYDKHELLRLNSATGDFAGYWTGTNSQNIVEIAEKLKIPGNEKIIGISLGIGKLRITSPSSTSRIAINVYNLTGNLPSLIYSQNKNLRDLTSDAMNYIPFQQSVEPTDSFLVAVNFVNINSTDSIAIFQAVRLIKSPNSLFIKKSGELFDFSKINNTGYGGALALEVLACNIGSMTVDTPNINLPLKISLFPNPTTGIFQVTSESNLSGENIAIFNILGGRVNFDTYRLGPRKLEINFSGNAPGMYVIRVVDGKRFSREKVVLVTN